MDSIESAPTLARVETRETAILGTTPQEIINRACEIADSILPIIEKRKLFAEIDGKKYPLCEAWTLAGALVGVHPRVVKVEKDENGYLAYVEAVSIHTGKVLSSAWARCDFDEEIYSRKLGRATKRWKDKYAVLSMAQTRATAKALRMPLGFIVHLAGLEPTPAEEMIPAQIIGRDDDEEGGAVTVSPKETPSQTTETANKVQSIEEELEEEGQSLEARQKELTALEQEYLDLTGQHLSSVLAYDKTKLTVASIGIIIAGAKRAIHAARTDSKIKEAFPQAKKVEPKAAGWEKQKKETRQEEETDEPYHLTEKQRRMVAALGNKAFPDLTKEEKREALLAIKKEVCGADSSDHLSCWPSRDAFDDFLREVQGIIDHKASGTDSGGEEIPF